MIGREVGHYQILDNLGSGGMGEVWLAQDTRLERKVALKFLHYHAAQLEADKARFIQEAKAAARLNHSNIAQVHEIGESEGRLYIVMEYVAGGSLRDRLDDAGGRSFPVSQVIRWIRQTTEGLAEAHSQGIVHRDIKPDNLMLTDKDQVKITDFGLARLDTESRLTATGATLGTVSYMSPEQVLGSSVDQRADLFSVGATFYELLTGRQPFEGPDAAAIYYAIIHAEPDPIARYLKKADHHLDLMVKKLLQKDPGNRYQHADDLLVDLKQMEVSLADTQSMTLKVAAPKPKSEGIFETLSRPVVKWIALGGVVLTIALGLSLLINPRWFTSKDNQNEAVEQLFERFRGQNVDILVC